MSFNINTTTINVTSNAYVGGLLNVGSDARVTGNFIVDTTTTLNDNLFCEGDIFAPFLTEISSMEKVKELVFDMTTNKIVRRPTDSNFRRILDDRFEYVSTNWAQIPTIGSIGDPVIDSVTAYLSYPTASNTVGTIISTYPWRINMNDTNDVYCYSMSNSVNGMYIFIPNSASLRHFFIHRPFGAYRGNDTKTGFYFNAKFAVTALQTGFNIFIGCVSPNGAINTFNLDGSNLLSLPTDLIGFMIDHSIYGTYKLMLVVRKASTNTMYQTAMVIGPSVLYELKMYWNNDYSNLTFAYGTNIGGPLIYKDVTTFASNPDVSIKYDPCISVNRTASYTFGLAITKMMMVSEEVS